MDTMIAAILADLKSKEKFGVITRRDYTRTNPVKSIMREIEAVGKHKNPDFVIDENNRFAYENLAKWLVGDSTMMCINPETRKVEAGSLTKGIYLAGKTGTGKTWAMDIISYLGTAHGFKMEVMGKEMVINMGVVNASRAVERFVNNEGPLTHRIICFNDLGTEQKESVFMGNRLNVMRDYIERRGEDQLLITSFTSNFPMNHPFMAESYGERAVSRLKQMCNYLKMDGADRRR